MSVTPARLWHCLPKAADECPLLARHEAVRFWALGSMRVGSWGRGELVEGPVPAWNGFGIAPPVCALRFPT